MIATLPVVQSVRDLRIQLARHRAAGRRIAFVPTMGALHDGHAALIRRARQVADVVVTSCYVNPLQFGPNEDLATYPQHPEADVEVAADAGTDIVWQPRDADIYPADPSTAVRVYVGPLGAVLEGAARPGHFDGVATVVVRLLGAVQPQLLMLGEKDFQQVVVLRRVVDQLLMPVEIVTVPTVREHDGLARSSRNERLNVEERQAAASIPRALNHACLACAGGEASAAALIDGIGRELSTTRGLVVDRIDIVDPTTLEPVAQLIEPAQLLVAVRIGSTRLIDNLRLDPHNPPSPIEDPA